MDFDAGRMLGETTAFVVANRRHHRPRSEEVLQLMTVAVFDMQPDVVK
jgi:hypothetical protein